MAMPALLKSNHTSGFTESQIPDINPDTLRSLTEQIASNLKTQGKGPISKDIAARPKTKTSNLKKEFIEHVTKSPVLISALQAASNDSTERGKQNPTVASKPSQGKKRLRDGCIKEESDETKAKNVGTSKRNIGSGNDNSIDEEIRVLGGTKEDVELVANIISGSEIEDEEARPSKDPGDGLEKEVLKLVRQLGVDRVAQKDLMADSDFEEAEEAEKLEENWNPNVTTFVGRGQRSLVSKKRCPLFHLPNDHTKFGLA